MIEHRKIVVVVTKSAPNISIDVAFVEQSVNEHQRMPERKKVIGKPEGTKVVIRQLVMTGWRRSRQLTHHDHQPSLSLGLSIVSCQYFKSHGIDSSEIRPMIFIGWS